MPDITDLLASAARTEIGGPDLARVEQRAVVLRRRQRLARSVAAAGVTVVAVVLFQGAGAGTQGLEQIPADRAPRPTTTTATSAPAPDAGPLSRPGPITPRDATARTDGAATRRPAAVPGIKEQDPEPTSSSTSASDPRDEQFPPAPSCSVSTTALLPEQTATCRFTATTQGGYRISGSSFVFPSEDQDPVAYVEVLRDGHTTRYDVWRRGFGCGTNVIEAGDLVTVTAGQARTGSHYDYGLSAGGGHACRGT